MTAVGLRVHVGSFLESEGRLLSAFHELGSQRLNQTPHLGEGAKAANLRVQQHAASPHALPIDPGHLAARSEDGDPPTFYLV